MHTHIPSCTHHIRGKRCQHRRIHRPQESVHRSRPHLQAQRTLVLLQQDARLHDAPMEERAHNGRQHGNRHVAADVAEFAQSQSAAIVIVHQHAGDAAHGAQNARPEADRCAVECRKQLGIMTNSIGGGGGCVFILTVSPAPRAR